MNYYIQGDAANADKIKAAFEKKGIDVLGFVFADKTVLYCSIGGCVQYLPYSINLMHILYCHPDYKELELPIEPKFKAEDRIVSKSDKSTVYRIITLHEERREYIVEIEHKDYHESCPWIAFEDQDDYELAPKSHYDIANFHAGMPVLVRGGNCYEWRYVTFSHYRNAGTPFCASGQYWYQCIPYEGNEHLLGTTDMPSEEYINW